MAMIVDRIQHGSFRTVGRASSRRLTRAASEAVGAIVTMLLDWQERARQRQQLFHLDDAALKDFGRSRADAYGETAKPFWRP